MYVKKKYVLIYSNCDKKILMMPNGEGEQWHYLAVKILSLLRGITSKNSCDFCFLNCLHDFRIKNLSRIKKYVIFPLCLCLFKALTKIFEFNQYQKSDKASLFIGADLECLIQNNDGCKNNPEKSSTIKVRKHIPSGFSMSAISSFRRI